MSDKIRLQVIGDPISHSLSPILHSTVLEELGTPCEYSAVQVKKGELSQYLASAKENNVQGFNITMPHKTDIIPLLDFIHPEVLVLGSVNTVKIENGELFGINTDGKGFMKALENTGTLPQGKNVVILGAGGVSETIAQTLSLEGAKKITILNRTRDKAKVICKKIRKTRTAHMELNSKNLRKAAKRCHILVNCTPLGMHGSHSDFEDLSFLDALPKDALVYDLIYNPEETNLLKKARELGLQTLNGLDMLIFQGLIADEFFLNKTLDFGKFEEKIKNNMKKLKK